MKKLIFISPNQGGLAHVLQEGTVVIGKGKGCDITFLNDGLDDMHAEIAFSGDACRIRDLGSKMGTFINGVRVMDGYPQHGDRVMFGRLEAQYDSGESMDGIAGRDLPGRVQENPHAAPSVGSERESGLLDEQIAERRRLLGGLETVILKRQSELGEVGEKRRVAEQEIRSLHERKRELERHLVTLRDKAGDSPALLAQFPASNIKDLEKREEALLRHMPGGLAEDEVSLFSRPARVEPSSELSEERDIKGPPAETAAHFGLDVLDLSRNAVGEIAPWQATGEELPPVGWYAGARATGGDVHFESASAVLSQNAIVILIGNNWEAAEAAITLLRHRGRPLYIAWGIGGIASLAVALREGSGFQQMRHLCSLVDGVLCSREDEMQTLAAIAGAERCHLLPMVCPIDRPSWNFSIPQNLRSGILLADTNIGALNPDGVFYLDFLLDLADFCNTKITVFGDAALPFWDRFEARKERLSVVPRPVGYQAFLTELAGHRIALGTFQASRQGDLAGDALLCRTLAISLPESPLGNCFSGIPDPFDAEVGAVITRLVRDDVFYHEQVQLSQERATQTASYKHFRECLELLLGAGSNLAVAS